MKNHSRYISQQKDTDFVWQEEPEYGQEPATLLVFQQNEKGFATFLVGMGLVGDMEPCCRIYSKLFDVGAYNSAPEPTFPEWRMYQTRNADGRRFYILRLTHTHPLPTPQSGDTTWLYTYPIIRDIIMEMNPLGVDELVYLTTNMMQSSIGYDSVNYATVEQDEVAVFDYCLPDEPVMTTYGKTLDKDIVLPNPSWVFATLFDNLCTNEIRGCWISIGGNARSEFIDSYTAKQLLRYCANVLGLEKHDKEQIENLTTLLHDLEGLTDAPTLDRIMSEDDMGDFFRDYI